MGIPNKVTGAGNYNAQNVFRCIFSEALSTPPVYEAWDNTQTFPARDPKGTTTSKEIFTGTAGNSYKPMLYLVATSVNPPGPNWKPTTATPGSANPNRLKGTTNYVTDPTTPGANGAIRWNLGVEVPADATVPSDVSMNHLIQIRYTFTGPAPTLTFFFNEGSEGSPIWTEFTPGTHGIRYCNIGTNWSTGPYKLTLPESGVIDAGEIGVTS